MLARMIEIVAPRKLYGDLTSVHEENNKWFDKNLVLVVDQQITIHRFS